MSAVFLKLLNMSITAGWLLLAVFAARLLLKKAPRWIACLLWALAALRLLLPFSLKSVFSLVPSAETVPADIAVSPTPTIHTGIGVFNSAVNPIISETFAPEPAASANPLQTVLLVASVVWAVGVAAMLLYALISFLRLRKTVAAAVPVGKRILLCDEVKTPFILGVFRPKICLPSSMRGETLDCVIAHETAHLRRRDHWWKPLGFLLLSVYWFNPLCWIAYILLCRDIEAACDEKVIRDMDHDRKAAYSQALLDCSMQRRSVTACPLAFGEAGVKQRVRGVLNYKKPAFWIILIAVIVCVVIAVCLLTDPRSDGPSAEQELSAALQPFMDALQQPDMGGMTMTAYVKSSMILDARQFSPEDLIAFIEEHESLGDVIYLDNDELQQHRMLLSRIRPENFVLEQASRGSKDVMIYLVFESEDHEVLLEITGFGYSEETTEVRGMETPYTLFLNGVEVKLNDFYEDLFYELINDRLTEIEDLEATWETAGRTVAPFYDVPGAYLCDLTGDGVPERCYTGIFGSGMVDKRIIVHNNVTGTNYELSDRGRFDYRLFEQDGELLVEKRSFTGGPDDGELLAIGRLELDGDELRFVPLPDNTATVETPPARTAAAKWFDFQHGDEEQWLGKRQFTTDAFPDTVFQCSDSLVEAVTDQGTVQVISGMPIESVYVCDLNGDGAPEICAAVYYGSGMIDERIEVCDYRSGAWYELSSRGKHDYSLHLQDGELIVEKRRYMGKDILATGRLTLEEDGLHLYLEEQAQGEDADAESEKVDPPNVQILYEYNIKDVLTRIYTDEELTEIAQFKGTLSELDQKWRVQCLRERESVQYVVYRSESDLLFLYFDMDGKQSAWPSRYRMTHTREEFETIQVGDTLDDVMAFDPDGSYLWLYTGRVDAPRVSNHCTTDGYTVSIAYDDEYVITKIDIRII